MNPATGESPPRSMTGSSVSTRSVIEALRHAEDSQAHAFQSSTGHQAMAAHHNWEETGRLRLQIESAPRWDDNFDATLYSVPAGIPSWLPNSVARLFGQEYDAKTVITNLAKERAANPTGQQAPYPTLSSRD